MLVRKQRRICLLLRDTWILIYMLIATPEMSASKRIFTFFSSYFNFGSETVGELLVKKKSTYKETHFCRELHCIYKMNEIVLTGIRTSNLRAE